MKTTLKFLIAFSLFGVACGKPLPTQKSPVTTQSTKRVAVPRKPVAPYTGPVDISFRSDAVSPTLAAYGFHASKGVHIPFVTEKVFHTQSTSSTALFENTSVIDSDDFYTEKTVLATDTQQRYTLQLKVDTPLSDNVELEVLINGFPWLKSKDISSDKLVFAKEGILLESSNKIELKVKGDYRGGVQLSLIDAGSAGIIRNTLNPSTSYTGPIFDPNNPLTLGALTPLPQIPKVKDGRVIPSVSLNGGVGSSFSAGEFQVRVKAPVEDNLQEILSKYAGSVTSILENDEFALFLDISKADLKALPERLRELNALLDGDAALKSVAFDSLEGAQNFALMVELLLAAQKGEWIESLDINPVLVNNSAGSYEGRSTSQNLSMNAQDSWWLRDTGVLEAWKYTMGYQRQNNRPVKVAVVDSSFKHLDKLQEPGQDMQGQILTTRFAEVGFETMPQQRGKGAYYNRVLSEAAQEAFITTEDPGNKTAHGTSQISTIASNINDKVGVVGIAPHAKIIPIKIGEEIDSAHAPIENDYVIVMGWSLRVALEAAGILQSDVVSITHSNIVNAMDNWLQRVNAVTTSSPYGWLSSLQYQVDLLELPKGTTPQSNQVICVFNAGNMGNHVRNTLPAGRLKNIVIAGALSPNNGSFERAIFDNDKSHAGRILFDNGNLDSNQEMASAWWTNSGSPGTGGNIPLFSAISQWESGSGFYNLKIWAPGRDMGAQGVYPKDINDLPEEQRPLSIRENWGGTSAATPFTAGALALLKAVQPNATVKSILAQNLVKYKTIQTQDNLLKDYYDDGENRRGVRLEPFNLSLSVVDVEETIKSHSYAQNINNQARTFTGVLKKAANNRPYLKNGDQEIDLSLFTEEPEFHTASTLNVGAGPRLKALSTQLEQDHYQSFWNQVAFAANGYGVTHKALINKPIRVTGWLYQAPEETDPYNIEIADVSREIQQQDIVLLPIDEGGFKALSVNGTPQASQIPQNSYVYDKTGNRWLVEGQTLNVDVNDFVGIQFNQPIRTLEVKIGPVLVPIVDIIENLAVIGIPDDLPAGVHDAIITASGQSLTLEDVVSKATQQAMPYVEPAATPASVSPGQDKRVRVFNISEGDQGKVYLNDILLATVNGGEDESINLGPYTEYPLRSDQRNEVRFELENNQGDGYTYGFEIYMEGASIFKDVQGQANSHWVKNSSNEIDTKEGLAYQERVWLHNTGILPVGAGDFWIKVSQMDNDEELEISVNNHTGDSQWNNDHFVVKPEFQTFYKKLPWTSESCSKNENCWCESYDAYCWTSNYLSYSLFNQSGGYSHNIEIYKGIYLIYRDRAGQKDGWGADQNNQDTSTSWPVKSNGIAFWKFGPKP